MQLCRQTRTKPPARQGAFYGDEKGIGQSRLTCHSLFIMRRKFATNPTRADRATPSAV